MYLGGIGQISDGMVPFYGINRMSIVKENAAAFYSGIQSNIWKAFYILPIWNVGKASDEYKELFETNDLIYGYGITLALKTPFGSIEYTSSQSSDEEEPLQFWSVGYKF